MKLDPTILRRRHIQCSSRMRGMWTAALILCTTVLWTQTAQATPPIGTGDTIEFADTANSLGTGVSWDVALGDLDGDGDFDAFVAKDDANSVWTNDGAGVFTSSGQSLGNSESFGVALGDVDGDGDLDAFVANRGGGEPNRVWLNNGSGNFTDSGQTLGRAQSYGIGLADLDGDGDLDAFVANVRANKVWTNNGSGVFTDSGQSLEGSSATISDDVALGDLDGDGDVDAFVANFASGGGAKPDTIWINDGSGSFASGGQVGSSDSGSVALGDVDGDGDLDAFVPNFGEPDKMWLNNGSGGFTDSGQNLGSSNSSAVALGDLDGDGDFDVLVANKVWQNDGSGLFSAVAGGLGSGSSLGVALGDLDGDGDLDAFVAKDGVDRVRENRSVHRNAPFALTDNNVGSAKSFTVVLGDVDGDGDLDAITANANRSDSPNTVWKNDGHLHFTNSGARAGTRGIDIALGDLDRDGDLDAFVTQQLGGDLVVLNDGSGTFTGNGQNLRRTRSEDVALGDLDRDGDLDAFVAGRVGEANVVWRNDGSAQFSEVTQSPPLGSSSGTGVALGDVDGDGDLDAFVVNYDEPNKVWRNNGSALFTDSGQSLGTAQSIAVDLGDLDGDGDLDAFVANSGQPNKVYVNNGSGRFTDSGQSLARAGSFDVTLGDLDGDGDLDAFVANLNATDRVWWNDGNGAFATSTDVGSSDDSSYDVALGDLDTDGDLDAFVVKTGGRPHLVWRNEGGSAGLTVSDTSPVGAIPNNSEDDLLKVVFRHNGIAADHNLELNLLNLGLLREDCTTVLTSAEANAIIENLRLRLDDGDGAFRTDGSDVLVTGGDIADLSLTDGVQTMTFTNDDTDVQVDQDAASPRTYWISVLTTNDADQQNPSGFCLRFDPDSDVLVEAKTPDFSVSVADTVPTDVLVASDPLAVSLGWFLAERDGDTISFRWQTATETGTAGFNVLAETEAGPVQLNAELIPSPVIDSVTPTDYAFEAATAATRFMLQEVGIDGGMTEHGPFELSGADGPDDGPGDVEPTPSVWLPMIQGE